MLNNQRSIVALATLVALLFVVRPDSATAQSCEEIVPTGISPESAEDYLYPLSLRINLIYLVKREMRERGEYEAELDYTFSEDFQEAIKEAQARLGEPMTGCLTWTVVSDYDPLNRPQPNE